MNAGELGILIPIIAVILGMTMGMITIITEHQRKSRTLEQRHRERMAAIEKGLELPPDPPRQIYRPSPERYLLRGMIWLGVGVAFALALPGLVGDRVAHVGWVIAAVGAAYLIFYATETRRKPPQLPDSSEPRAPDRF